MGGLNESEHQGNSLLKNTTLLTFWPPVQSFIGSACARTVAKIFVFFVLFATS
jgi:hypothetical protein